MGFFGNFVGGVLIEDWRGVGEKATTTTFPFFRCPTCKKVGTIDDDQYHGRVSIVCVTPFCDYHETKDWSEGGSMKGCVGLCSKGSLGLITSETRQEVTYGDGTEGTAWVGVHLTSKLCAVGSPWSSRSPEIVMDAVEVDGLIRAAASLKS